MGNQIPLSVLMENAKGKLISAFNQIVDETKLPAFLLEGVLLELLSEIRSRKNLELIADMNSMKQGDKSSQNEVNK